MLRKRHTRLKSNYRSWSKEINIHFITHRYRCRPTTLLTILFPLCHVYSSVILDNSKKVPWSHNEVTSEAKIISTHLLSAVYKYKSVRTEYDSTLWRNKRISGQSITCWHLVLHLYDNRTEMTKADHQISGNGGLDFVPIETEVTELRDSCIKGVIKSVSWNRADVRGVHTCNEYRYIYIQIDTTVLSNFLFQLLKCWSIFHKSSFESSILL